MTANIIIILACVPLYIANSFCDKIVSTINANKYNYLYNLIKFIICSICAALLLFFEYSIAFGVGGLICGIICGVMYAVSKTVMLKGFEKTSVAFMILCHSSGMILPCILGHFFWNEPLSIISLIGIILAIISIVLLKNNGNEKSTFNIKGILYGLVIFLTSAGVMIVQKIMGIYLKTESVALYNLYSFLVPAIILCFFIKPKALNISFKKDKKRIIACAAVSAVSLCVVSFVMTNLASRVPSVILFPLFNGLGIICVCIGSIFAFKEKLNGKKIIGLILGVLGLFLINL